MSKTTKWVIGVVVVLIIAVFVWNNMSNTAGTSQSAAVINSNSTTSAGLDQINRDVASIDFQMQASGKELANLGTTPTQSAIVVVATHLKTISTLILQEQVKLSASMINSKSTSLQATLNDMTMRAANASSQLGVILSNTLKISGATTSASNATLKQALVQLQTAASYLQAARIDIQTILGSLK